MRAILGPLLLAAMLWPPAQAATLRPFGRLSGPTVTVSDLWDGAGGAASLTLGPAPAPGERIVVEAAQLAAIARQFGVDWRPDSGPTRSVLERPGVPLAADRVVAALREALGEAAPADSDLDLSAFTPPLVDPGAPVTLTVEQCVRDAGGGRFTAHLAVTGASMLPLRLVVAGQIVAMDDALVATRRLAAGALLTPADLMATRIARERLHGPVATSPSQAAGMMLRRAVPQGEPLLLGDLAPPLAVTKGARVAVSIESGGIAVTGSAEALQAGAVGERITVRNPASRAVLLAQITGPNAVRVEPGSTPIQRPAATAAP